MCRIQWMSMTGIAEKPEEQSRERRDVSVNLSGPRTCMVCRIPECIRELLPLKQKSEVS